ncbi:MAG: hypothetical protein QM647_16240 [Asticcacaulis sp.]|uniref:hypothetical protein n=1 Tax=Asticcacaulis sp. TaxID=1872648 RepID=UPI0039E3C9F4
MLIRMALDNPTASEQLTPEARRTLLRAFADRMLMKVTAMDTPEDLPGVEKAVRVASMIERLYSRCDHAERQKREKTPDPHKREAECARQKEDAIKARVSLANTLKWGEARRKDLGQWWDAAQTAVQPQPQALAPRVLPPVTYVDYTDCIESARAALGLPPDTPPDPNAPPQSLEGKGKGLTTESTENTEDTEFFVR